MKQIILFFLFVFLVSCNSASQVDFEDAGNVDSGSEEMNQLLTGEQVFRTRVSDGNLFSCQNCHTAGSVNTRFRTAGHDLTDAAARNTFKNGQLTELREAVNNCVEHWMLGSPWGEDHPRWIALSEWLEELAPNQTTNLSYNIVQPPNDLTGGSVSSGRSIFNNTCAGCHGIDARGASVGPGLIGTSLARDEVAQRIRLSGPITTAIYPGLTGGRMPFWAEDRLSDSELIDILAYVESLASLAPPPPPPPVSSGAIDISVANAQNSGQCGSNHPDVGRQTTLSTFSHQVRGTVEIIDNCTIEIRNFTFDGGGIDVRMYSGTNRNFFAGRAISRDIFGTRFQNQTVRFRLPQGMTLDSFNGVSVWCVAVGISFGDGSW